MLFERQIEYSAELKASWLKKCLDFFLLMFHSLSPKSVGLEQKMVCFLLSPVLLVIVWQAVNRDTEIYICNRPGGEKYPSFIKCLTLFSSRTIQNIYQGSFQ